MAKSGQKPCNAQQCWEAQGLWRKNPALRLSSEGHSASTSLLCPVCSLVSPSRRHLLHWAHLERSWRPPKATFTATPKNRGKGGGNRHRGQSEEQSAGGTSCPGHSGWEMDVYGTRRISGIEGKGGRGLDEYPDTLAGFQDHQTKPIEENAEELEG